MRKIKRIPFETNPQTIANLNNRFGHGRGLRESLDKAKSSWTEYVQESWLEGILNDDEIPLFLQIDTWKIKIEALKWLGIELISEEENGYIIGSSISISKLEKKITDFLEQNWRSKNQAAQLWKIDSWIQWRLEHILSADLSAIWDNINEDEVYEIEVGVACQKIPIPKRKVRDTDIDFEVKMRQWENDNYQKEIDRESQLEAIVNAYNGIITDQINFEDSFCYFININGKWLKNIAIIFPFVFEIKLQEDIDTISTISQNEEDIGLITLESPEPDNAGVCVMDSGIQENHILLSSMVRWANSRSYLPHDTNVWDANWHGTSVGWVVIYPSWIPRTGSYKANCWIENARILDHDRKIPKGVMIGNIMKQVTDDFYKPSTRLFNLSVNSSTACRTTHVSSWSAEIDRLSYENDLLFVISSWNLDRSQIRHHLSSYPEYLHKNECRIANPWQSLFGVTVGSICPNGFETVDERSISPANHISSFSRSWFWIWDSIKPELVEYGGEYVVDKITPYGLRQKEPTSIETTNSTLTGGKAYSKDSIGTSFSAPKVCNILAQIQNSFPEKSTLFYKALLIQSARWPSEIEITEDKNENANKLARYGYWLPNINRALQNNSNRITFIDDTKKISGKQANIYAVHVPVEIRWPSMSAQVLIEVTLVYKSKSRRTRKGTKSYLSTWMSWISSKPWETIEEFRSRVIQEWQKQESEPIITTDDPMEDTLSSQRTDSFKWIIQDNKRHGKVAKISRSNSATQKDWTIINAYDLPESFFIWVIGHNGWEKDTDNDYPYAIAVSFESLDGTIQIYEQMIEVNQVQTEIESLF